MSEQGYQDLIIIKRRSFEPEALKGGVWKIAFADFMTAMMCFFLVMWLINAANEDTRQAVASYFNPVKLTELNRKGLSDPKLSDASTGDNAEATLDAATPPAEAAASSALVPTDAARDALFRDPYGVLSEIAGKGEAGGGAAAAAAGAAAPVFRDPFAPESEVPNAAADSAAPPASATPSEMQTATVDDRTVERAGQDQAPAAPSVAEPAANGLEQDVAEILPATEAEMAALSAAASKPGAADAIMSLPPGVASPDDNALARQLSDIAQAEGVDGRGNPGLTVERTGEGTLISLTDEMDFGMFEIGSAEPAPATIRIMQKIAEILKTRTGLITIRGHTDARPFRGGGYDNWRLSTDRAQIAYYMLVRGGLDERRVLAIEGYADRRPKLPDDPEAAENRRIEILLHEEPA